MVIAKLTCVDGDEIYRSEANMEQLIFWAGLVPASEMRTAYHAQ
jgi:hypothetical protein